LGDGRHDELVQGCCVAVPRIDSVDEYVLAIAVGFINSGDELANKFLRSLR
jgi:hypothetical protein